MALGGLPAVAMLLGLGGGIVLTAGHGVFGGSGGRGGAGGAAGGTTPARVTHIPKFLSMSGPLTGSVGASSCLKPMWNCATGEAQSTSAPPLVETPKHSPEASGCSVARVLFFATAQYWFVHAFAAHGQPFTTLPGCGLAWFDGGRSRSTLVR